MPTLCPLLHHAGIPWMDSDPQPQGSLFVSTSATLSSFYSGVLINLSIQSLDYIFSSKYQAWPPIDSLLRQLKTLILEETLGKNREKAIEEIKNKLPDCEVISWDTLLESDFVKIFHIKKLFSVSPCEMCSSTLQVSAWEQESTSKLIMNL